MPGEDAVDRFEGRVVGPAARRLGGRVLQLDADLVLPLPGVPGAGLATWLGHLHDLRSFRFKVSAGWRQRRRTQI